MRPLFIIGNKRSGTSQLVRILNLHPEIFIAHESDIIWILHQFYRQEPFRAHEWDSDLGMKHTLSAAGQLLERNRPPGENFQAVLSHLMTQGTPWLPPVSKPGIRWLGDKKPFQHTDPRLVPFILEHFPDALFLHIVRHPCAVVASSDHFNAHAGDFWLGLSASEKLQRWTYHEKRVEEMKLQLPGRIHTLRYEDLCRQTELELTAVFHFLGVSPDTRALKDAARQTLPSGRTYSKIDCPVETLQLAARHGYDLEKPAGRMRTLGARWYWKLAKRFH
ncbi:MAG TPA: sulfotransferase [Verrucomicrobiae bacterium]|nr:sulfotransferase [Verrucomicrobiae bacterium]